jgi:hypothetical protein
VLTVARNVLNRDAYVVKDGGGQKLAYVYYEEEPGRRSSAKLLTKDEARRIAANIAKLTALERIPVRFEHSLHGERNCGILSG